MLNIEEKEKKERIVFFIGAGLTKDIINTAPVGNEFFQKGFNSQYPHYSNDHFQRVRLFIEEIYYNLESEQYPRIEDVLSLIDYSIERKEPLSHKYLLDELYVIREDIIYLIGKVISHELENKSEEELIDSREFISMINNYIDVEDFYHGQYSQDMGISIISTNYDLILDNSLIDVTNYCNYGFMVRQAVRWHPAFETRPVFEFHDHLNTDSNGMHSINSGVIPLLKIHGSLNWLYCPRCDEIDISVGRKALDMSFENRGNFHCFNSICTSTYDPLIITQTMYKKYSLRIFKQLWEASEKVLSKANRIIFIGYSLSEGDFHIRSLLTRSLINNRDVKVIIISKIEETEEDEINNMNSMKRYQALFGENKTEFHPIGFSEFLKRWDEFIPTPEKLD